MAVTLKRTKSLSVFSLVMINVIAVDSLRTLPFSAEYGFSLVFYYLLAAVIFFVPVSLVAAELATMLPHTGGLYIWVREAFGKKMAFMTVWLQWVYNIVWFPTILAFIASTLAYFFSPQLATNKLYLVSVILATFWFATIANCFGMRLSGMVSIVCALLGTLLPMLIIIILAIIWLVKGYASHIVFSSHYFFPHLTSVSQLALFASLLFGLVGMEMSAIHAGDVKNPQRDYPKALFFSTIIILGSLILASLAIAVVVPQEKLSLVTGLIDAFTIFFKAYHLAWMVPMMVVFIIVSGFGSVSAWILGPAKALMVSANDGLLPKRLGYINKHGAPVALLIAQGVVFSLLTSLYVFVDNIDAVYVLLSAATAQLALLIYVFMFAAVIKLRVEKPQSARAFKVPGGLAGVLLVAGMGIATCLIMIAVGFVPPEQVPIKRVSLYEAFLLAEMALFVIIPWVLTHIKYKKLKNN